MITTGKDIIMEKGYFEKLEANQRKQTGLLRVTAICSVLICLCMIVITLAIVNMVPQITNALGQVETLAGSANQAVTDIEKIIPELEQSAKSMTEISRSITTDGLPKLYESLDNLNKVDVETLNESIKGLSDVVSPLAKLFGR